MSIKGLLSRRGFMAAAPAAAAAAPYVAKDIVNQAGQFVGEDSPAYPPSTGGYATALETINAIQPKMSEKAALALARLDPDLKEKIEDWVRENYCPEGLGDIRIDHDIRRKCWSEAAKIYAQRERNYQRRLKEAWGFFDRGDYPPGQKEHPVRAYMNKLMYG